MWPGITPFNVWDLRLYEWRGFAESADVVKASEQKQASKHRGR